MPFKRILSGLATAALAAGLVFAPTAAEALNGGPNGWYDDLCSVSAYPNGCAEQTFPYQGVNYLDVFDDATNGTTSGYVQDFVWIWNTYVWANNPNVAPQIFLYTNTDGCTNNGLYTMTICNGSAVCSTYGYTYGCTQDGPGPVLPAGDQLVIGSYTQINVNAAIANAEGGVWHEMFLAMGWMEFASDSDPGGVSVCNEPGQNTSVWTTYDQNGVLSWYGGAGE